MLSLINLLNKQIKTMNLSRSDFEKIVVAGIKVGEFTFLKGLINTWLSIFPNDLQSEYFLSNIAYLEDKPSEAIDKISGLLLRDPENVEGFELLNKMEGVQDKKAVCFVYPCFNRQDHSIFQPSFPGPLHYVRSEMASVKVNFLIQKRFFETCWGRKIITHWSLLNIADYLQ